jgi:hypothetical protein
MKTEFKTWAIGYILAPFSWSAWADICTFTWLDNAYLLQGKVNRRTNEKRFMVTSTNQRIISPQNVGEISMDRLKECNLINEQAI